MRRDGQIRFGPQKRWIDLYALSFRWNVIDEPWMKSTRKWLSMLSIAPGWGNVATPPGGDYLYFSKYGVTEGYMDMTGIIPNNIRLTTLRAEKKTTWNVGINVGVWDDRLTMNLNLYSQTTRDLLMRNRAIPTSSGYSAFPYQNVGDMRNEGWEFNIRGNDVVRVGKFKMGFNVNFANNTNEILKMNETVLESLNSDFNKNNGSYLTRVQVQNPFGAIYGFKYKGVYQYSEYNEAKGHLNAPVARNAQGQVVYDQDGKPKPMYFCYDDENIRYKFQGGDAIYEDVNNDGNINALDIVYLGNSLPKITGGFGFRFNYGNWGLNMQFNFRYDIDIINYAKMHAENMYSNNNQSQAVNWRWRKEGDVTPMPRALRNAGYNYLGSDRFVEDASFLRLNYLQLSYAFTPRLLKQIGFSQLNLYGSMNNVFCLTKYSGVDPEVGYGGYGIASDNAQTPRSKSFTVGATVSF